MSAFFPCNSRAATVAEACDASAEALMNSSRTLGLLLLQKLFDGAGQEGL
jgi:hypothetical protein